jgi:hypothetical protein
VFESERQFLEIVRGSSQPVASQELRARVTAILNNSETPHLAPTELRLRVQRAIWQLSPASSEFNSARALLVGLTIALLLLAGVWWAMRHRANLQRPGPSDFALMAANTHLRHQRGQLPLELVSDAPPQISAWFANKLPFSVQLPNYQESSGQEKLYRLEGARLVGYKADYAAYVAYQMQQRPISLVITSDAVAQPAGGEQIAAKGLTFHYNSIDGLKVITWSDRGLTYALVSDLAERGQQSCVVCHHGSRDQDFIETLRPSHQ